MTKCANHLSGVFLKDRFDAITDLFHEKVIKKAPPFDGLVVTGVSGLSIGFHLAHHYNLDIVAVRKFKEKSHSEYRVESSNIEIPRLMFVDDLVDKGHTLRRVKRSVTSAKIGKIVGIALYDEQDGINLSDVTKLPVYFFRAPVL